MQTFLPYADFKQSISILDGKRLFKQAVEAREILNTLLSGKGWIYHPAVIQWKNSELILLNYAFEAANECISRGINGHNELAKLKLLKIDPSHNNMPKWIGNVDIHSSHRSRLLCKGLGDSVCAGLKSVLKIKSIDDYLKNRIKKIKNQLKYADVIRLQEYYYSISKIQLADNYYAKFGWTDDPAAEYVWGSKI